MVQHQLGAAEPHGPSLSIICQAVPGAGAQRDEAELRSLRGA
jgi:hypothetical protein